MLRKVFKWTGIVVGALVGLSAVLVIVLYFMGNARLTKMYIIQPEVVAIATDPTAIERGKQWASSVGCTGCHAENLSGKPLIDDPTLGYIPAPNLTPGEGGAGSEFNDADWVRALRYGVDPEGRALLVMPSGDYYYMSDQDLSDLIAYLKSLPPVDHDMGEMRLPFMTKVFFAAGAFGAEAMTAESINHTAPRPSVVQAGATVEYGLYLVQIAGCRSCHGKELAGATGANGAIGGAYGTNLTPGGGFAAWSQETFITAMQTNQSRSKGMPWGDFAGMTNDQLKAIFKYLQSQPARENTVK